MLSGIPTFLFEILTLYMSMSQNIKLKQSLKPSNLSTWESLLASKSSFSINFSSHQYVYIQEPRCFRPRLERRCSCYGNSSSQHRGHRHSCRFGISILPGIRFRHIHCSILTTFLGLHLWCHHSCLSYLVWLGMPCKFLVLPNDCKSLSICYSKPLWLDG